MTTHSAIEIGTPPILLSGHSVWCHGWPAQLTCFFAAVLAWFMSHHYDVLSRFTTPVFIFACVWSATEPVCVCVSDYLLLLDVNTTALYAIQQVDI